MENKQVAGTLLAGILALVGVVIGASLTWMHIRSASGYEADSGVCDALSETGCSIALSESGMLLGMPISLIGVGGALAIVFCIAMSFFWPVRAAEDNRFLSLAWALGFVSVLASAGMAVVSFMDGRFCPLCVGWYFSNLGIFLATWWALRGSFFARVQSSLQSTFSVAGVGLTFGFTAFLMGGSLWMEGAVADGQEQRAELLKAQRELIQNELATREPQVVPELAHLPLKVGGMRKAL